MLDRTHSNHNLFLSECARLSSISAGETRPFENNSDLTVTRQWCNSDRTVMPLIWVNLCVFTVVRCHWSVFILLQGVGSVILNLLVTQDHLTKTMNKQWWDSDATVMQQWCLWFKLFNIIFKPFRCHWSNFILWHCLGSVFGETRPFDKNSNATVMPLIWVF
jgi:hypothetical protein